MTPEHRCGVRGFADSGDKCPGCVAENRHPDPETRQPTRREEVLAKLDEAIRDEGAIYILDRCAHYELLRDAADLLREDGAAQTEFAAWLRQQAKQMRYSQSASGYLIAEEWAEVLEAYASRVDPVPPPPDTPVFCAHCETALYHCPVCGKCEWRNGDPVPPPPHQDEQKG